MVFIVLRLGKANYFRRDKRYLWPIGMQKERRQNKTKTKAKENETLDQMNVNFNMHLNATNTRNDRSGHYNHYFHFKMKRSTGEKLILTHSTFWNINAKCYLACLAKRKGKQLASEALCTLWTILLNSFFLSIC